MEAFDTGYIHNACIVGKVVHDKNAPNPAKVEPKTNAPATKVTHEPDNEEKAKFCTNWVSVFDKNLGRTVFVNIINGMTTVKDPAEEQS